MTQHSPFEIVYGMQPASVLNLSRLPLPKEEHLKATVLADFVQQLHADIKTKIEANKAKHKAQADMKKRQVIFKEGDLTKDACWTLYKVAAKEDWSLSYTT